MDWWFEELKRMQENMERMMEEMKKPVISGFRQPVVDVINNPKEIVIIAELPGVDKKDISIDCKPLSITITAESKKEKKKTKQGYYYQERSSTSFKRVIALPEEVIPEKAKAEYKNGVLEVTLPKKKQAVKKKGIKIRVR